MGIMDPVQYGILRSKDATIELPVPGEYENARKSLAALYSLSYSCPLFYKLKPRERRRYVRKWMSNVEKDITNLGFVGAVKQWSDLGNLFLRQFVFDDKGKLSYEFVEDLSASPIATAMSSFMRLTSDTPHFFKCVEWCLSWHLYLSKVPISRPDLLGPSETDWIARQSDVKDVNSIPYDLIAALRTTLSVLYDEPFDSSVIGKHGPGSTNLGIRDVAGKEANYDPCLQSQSISVRPDVYSVPQAKPQASRYMVVPKDIKSVRPITMESIAMQFAQQALKRQIYSNVDRGIVEAKRFTRFANQQASRSLALRGSRFTSSDVRPITIDLSSASDYLGVELVAQVLPATCVHELLCARTWEVSVGKQLVEVGMYAGMGSATTFPVQTLMFMGIAVMAVVSAVYKKQNGGLSDWHTMLSDYLSRGSYFMRPSAYFNSIRIYGDDIIVPAIATEELIELLERFGLRINHSKSFYGSSAVREACGIYALAGWDITPTRYRIPVYTGLADYAVLESYREAANLSFLRDWLVLNRYLIFEARNLKLLTTRRDARKVNPLIFEEFRGWSNYIGFISLREPSTEIWRVFGTRKSCQRGYISMAHTERDERSEGYHYLQASFMLTYHDTFTEDHGRIPRGTRVSLRYAYQKSDGNGWAWAPV